MPNWITGKEAITLLDVMDFELPGLSKKHDVKIVTRYGREVRDADTLEWEKPTPEERRLLGLKSLLRRSEPPAVESGSSYGGGGYRRFDEDEMNRIKGEIEHLESQGVKAKAVSTLKKPSDYDEYKWISFTIPRDSKRAKEHISKFMEFLYCEDDLLKIRPRLEVPLQRTKSEPPWITKRHEESRRDRANVIGIAKKLWGKAKAKGEIITVPDMAYRDEINEVLEGRTYSDDTIKKWIRPHNPNPKPGRRPKQSN